MREDDDDDENEDDVAVFHYDIALREAVAQPPIILTSY